VVAGYSGDSKVLQSCERFNVFVNKWEELPETCHLTDGHTIGITLGMVRQRYIYGFGGLNVAGKPADLTIERVLRLDTWRL